MNSKKIAYALCVLSACLILTTGAGLPLIAAAEPSTCLVFKNTLKVGDTDKTKNGEVSKLQKYLKSAVAPTLTVSGIYGASTTEAVKDFEKKEGLVQSGAVTKNVQGKINEKCTAQTTKPVVGSISKISSFTHTSNESSSEDTLLLSSGKLAYISYDKKTERRSLYLNGVKIDDSKYISQLTDVSGKLAYVIRDENATTSSLVYDGKKIVKAVSSIQIADGTNGVLIYTIYDPVTQKTSLYLGEKRIGSPMEGSLGASDIKEFKGTLAYVVSYGGDGFSGGDSNMTLFYGDKKVDSIYMSPMMGPVFGFLDGILFYETYASTTKTFNLFYGEKKVSSGLSFFIPSTVIGEDLAYVQYGADRKETLYQGSAKIATGDQLRNVRIIGNKLAYSLVDKEKKKETLFWGGKEMVSLPTGDASSGVGFFELKEINGEPSYVIQKSLLDKKLTVNGKEITNAGTFPQVKSLGGKLLYIVKKNEKDQMSFGKEDVFYNGTTTPIDGLINFPEKDFNKGTVISPYYFYSSKSLPERRDPKTNVATFTEVLTVYKVD